METLRTCTGCLRRLPANSLHYRPRRDRPCGLSSMCRECLAERYGPKDRQRAFTRRPRRDPSAQVQQCCRCKQNYPATCEHFPPKPASVNGLASRCRVCDREIARDRMRRLRQEQPESVKDAKRRYAKSDRGRQHKRERSRVDNAKRRQRNTEHSFLWSQRDWERVQQMFGGRCAYCGSGGPFHQDHFIPLSHTACPGTIPGNIVPACPPCNLSKSARDPFEWVSCVATLSRILRILQAHRDSP
jgi:5-methylcytosine-specific restriction endonuclease McrA